MEEQLKELADEGLIQDQGIAEWKAPREHRVPSLNPGEIILFVPFVHAGLCLPTSPFLHRFLSYFDISLNHLTRNGVLHLSIFFIFVKPSLASPFYYPFLLLLSFEAAP
jgi:hypothetical protein